MAAGAATGAAAGTPASASAGAAAGRWDMVAFEVKSWGRPVTSWRLLANGSGSWTVMAPRGDAAGGAPGGTLTWHEVEVGASGYADVAAVLSRLPDPAPDHQACSDLMSDLPYGTLRLTRGATTVEIEWNSGCRDAPYQSFIATLKAADELVSAWGRAGRVLRTEPWPARP